MSVLVLVLGPGLGHSDTRLSPMMQRAVRIPPSSRKQWGMLENVAAR